MFWPGNGGDKVLNRDFAMNGNILSEDFCVSDGNYAVRCVLKFPLLGGRESDYFAFGVWGTLKKPNFEDMLKHFNTDQGHLGPYFSWLANALPGTKDSAKTEMRPQTERNRPLLILMDETHPFYDAQIKGISLDGILNLYALMGHDIRPVLSN